MSPAIEPGDWLLLDPTIRRWPRRGSIVVFREPVSGLLAVKRVAGRPGDRIRHEHAADGGSAPGSQPGVGSERAGALLLGPGEAWLLGDAPAVSIDSARYGPVSADRLVARAWFRYWPPRRLGPLGRRGAIRAFVARLLGR